MKRRFAQPFITILISVLILQLISCENNEVENIKIIDAPQIVQVSQVETIEGNNEIPYSGTIEESESFPLSFSVVGTVSRVLVSEGDVVSKGQLLAVLNDEMYKNTYEMTLATLKQAEDAYNRLKPMYDNGNLQEIKLVEVETALQQAKSATFISKNNVEDCKLYSPVSGIVGKRSIESGMIALPNLTSISIIKIEKVFAKVPVSENEIASIKKGDKAKIKIAALNNIEYSGAVEEIGVMADPIAHTYKIKISIANQNRQLKPGMICNVTLNKKNKDTNGLCVPNRAILVDEHGRNFVYTVSRSKAIRTYVKIGKLLTNGVEITDGLKIGEQIVVSGQHNLVDNSSIQIVNP